MSIAPQNGWQISQYSCSYSHLRISTRDDAVDDLAEIKASPRRLEHGAALLVPAIDGGRIQPYVVLVGAVEATVARGNAEDVADAVELLQPDDELSQHGVEPRAEPPAGDERSARAGRVDAQALPWASAAVGDERGRRGGSEVEEGVAEGDVSRGDVEGGRRVEGVTGDGVGNRSLRGQARYVAEGELRERHSGVGRSGGVPVAGVVVDAGVGRGGLHVSASERSGAAWTGETTERRSVGRGRFNWTCGAFGAVVPEAQEAPRQGDISPVAA
jgi:hypothetical protein